MQKKKVVIVHPSQLTQRWYDYYCLEDLVEKFDIEFWDCSSITFPNFRVSNSIKASILREISSISDFLHAIKKLPKDTILISEVHYNKSNEKIHMILSWYFPYIVHFDFYSNTQNDTDSFKSILLKKFRRLVSNSCIHPLRKLVFFCKKNNYFIDNIKYRNDQEYWIKKNRQPYGYKYTFNADCAEGTRHRINHPDFEKYLKIKDGNRLLSHDFIVYVDDFYPHHPEFSSVLPSNEIQSIANNFYQSLNSYFDAIEEKYNIPVVIAAHPYANYDLENPFRGRSFFYFKTAELVRDSNGVLIHGSNAFSYVILFQKPVALLFNKSFYKIDFLKRRMEACSYNFKIPLVNTDYKDNMNNLDLHKISDDFRQIYINKYLGDICNPKKNSELFVNLLDEFYDLVNVNL